MQDKTAIIIGSGVAALAAATRLSLQGFSVQVFEQNSYPGGKLSMFEKDGFRFDAGPSLFTQPQHIQELFEEAGEPMDEYFAFKRVDVACKYFFESGTVVNAFTDKDAFAAELNQQTGEPAQAVTEYLQRAGKVYNNIGKVFLQHSLHKWDTWINKRIVPALKTVRAPYLLSTLDRFNRKHFKTPEAVQIFNRYATYNGSNPYQAPAMLSVIPHLELNEGTFFPKGGMISITNALYELAVKKHVDFSFGSKVDRIIHVDGKARGVVVNGTNVYADIVVSNADIYFTYKHLLNHGKKARKVLKQERSSSALIFYWGISRSFEELGLHNIFFSQKYREEFEHIFKRKAMYTDPTVYINITSKEEQTHAPDGNENWFVMVNAPANCGQDWESMIATARTQIVEKLSRMLGTGIESFIKSETILDPVQIEQKTGSYMGSLYGTSSNSKLAAFFRAPNFSSYIKNLYCCGGSVHPGGGIPLCLQSAKITAAIIKKDFNRQREHSH